MVDMLSCMSLVLGPRMGGVWCRGFIRLVPLETSKVADLVGSSRQRISLMPLCLTFFHTVLSGLPSLPEREGRLKPVIRCEEMKGRRRRTAMATGIVRVTTPLVV